MGGRAARGRRTLNSSFKFSAGAGAPARCQSVAAAAAPPLMGASYRLLGLLVYLLALVAWWNLCGSLFGVEQRASPGDTSLAAPRVARADTAAVPAAAAPAATEAATAQPASSGAASTAAASGGGGSGGSSSGGGGGHQEVMLVE